jgi:hypothetical protein
VDPTGVEAPVPARRAAPLTRREKAWVAAAAIGPIVVAALVLTPVGVTTAATAADVAVASLVYGGLVGLAGGFVATDRLQARQCPRCRRRADKGTATCPSCGYDLEARPRFACSERHVAYLDDGGDGRCACGRRLEPLPTARGVGPQVRATVKVGAWLLAFLVAMGLVLRFLEARL